MAGKSTFLRQNALIAIMAQTGCFVPAKRGRIGVVDRLFCRVGAADDLARGRSTFMVEMVETAAILNQATGRAASSSWTRSAAAPRPSTASRSPGRWSSICTRSTAAAALFATHFHELAALAAELPALACHTLRVKEWRGDVVFLHEVAAGAADRSYGIHVARLAGLPESVLRRATHGAASDSRERGSLSGDPARGRSAPVHGPAAGAGRGSGATLRRPGPAGGNRS